MGYSEYQFLYNLNVSYVFILYMAKITCILIIYYNTIFPVTYYASIISMYVWYACDNFLSYYFKHHKITSCEIARMCAWLISHSCYRTLSGILSHILIFNKLLFVIFHSNFKCSTVPLFQSPFPLIIQLL